MPTITADITAAGVGAQFSIKPGEGLDYSASGTFTGYVSVEVSRGGAPFVRVTRGAVDTAISGSVKNETRSDERYRFRVEDTADVTPVTGTVATSWANTISPKKRMVPATDGKVGATSGFVVAAASNTSLVTCPASKTGSTLVVPVKGLKVGDTITGFHLVGAVNSAGGAVTVDADLRKQVSTSSSASDASVGAITQLAVTASVAMAAGNTRKAGVVDIVGADETFYVLITVTTAASTDITLQAVAIEYLRAAE